MSRSCEVCGEGYEANHQICKVVEAIDELTAEVKEVAKQLRLLRGMEKLGRGK